MSNRENSSSKVFDRLKNLLVVILGIAFILIAWLFTKQSVMSAAETQEFKDRFHFTTTYLNDTNLRSRSIREVTPALKHINSWVSAFGASVGFGDIDGNGLPDDVCLVDPRDDSVRIVPVEHQNYSSFELIPNSIPYSSVITAPMGCVPVDLNEDGWLDLVVYYWGRPPAAYLQKPNGGILESTSFLAFDIVSPNQVWNSSTLNIADLDGDGHLDIIVGNYYPDDARLLDHTLEQDPYLRMPESMSLSRNGGKNRILRFVETLPGEEGVLLPIFSEELNVFPDDTAYAWTLAIGVQDLNEDHLPEIYFANDFGPDVLFYNQSTPGQIQFIQLHGDRNLVEAKSTVLGNDSFKGGGVEFAELNDDGLPDILVTNNTTPFGLHESNFVFISKSDEFSSLSEGYAPYTNRSEELGLSRSGWSFDVKAEDFDMDGTPEILITNGFIRGNVNRWPQFQELLMLNDQLLRDPRMWPNLGAEADLSGMQQNQFYVQGSHERFVDIASALNLDNSGVSRGIAIADIEHDGRPDFAIANQWAPSTFSRNESAVQNYLGLTLLITDQSQTVSRAAIGAHVVVSTPAGQTFTRQLYPANGHSGKSAPEIMFGLDDAVDQVSVTVSWRDKDGIHQQIFTLKPGWHTVLLDSEASN